MTNIEKYDGAFSETFGVAKEQLTGLQYQGIPEWDSVGHMGLVSCIEECFGIMLETDDIIELSSYEKGKEIIAKYDVKL